MSQKTPPNSTASSHTEAQKGRLDKFVLVLVVVGIIVFAIFQIIQCVGAYTRPISASNLENRNRVLPGLMICPYADSGNGGSFQCERNSGTNALWAPDATLSFDFRWFESRQAQGYSSCSIDSKSYDSSDAFGILTAVDPLSLAKRSKCPNSYPLDKIPNAPKGGTPPIMFGAINLEALDTRTKCSIGNSARRVTVKNSGKSLICSSQGCRSLESNTPPNVQCLVYDPSYFDDDSKGTPGADSNCNPMREVNANTVDTFQITFPHISPLRESQESGNYGTWEYSGLRCPGFSPSQLKLSVGDFAKGLRSFEDKPRQDGMYNIMNLFGNFVALAYNSEKGVPKDIDFDDVTSTFSNGAVSSSQQNHILASTILTHVEKLEETVPPRNAPPYYSQRVFPVTLQASIAIQTRYTNVALNESNTTVTPTAVFAPQSNHPYRFPSTYILMSFSTVLTTVTTEVVTLSILTTISIIVSTATALWGAQQKIKDGILMVAAKVNEIRGTTQPIPGTNGDDKSQEGAGKPSDTSVEMRSFKEEPFDEGSSSRIERIETQMNRFEARFKSFEAEKAEILDILQELSNTIDGRAMQEDAASDAVVSKTPQRAQARVIDALSPQRYFASKAKVLPKRASVAQQGSHAANPPNISLPDALEIPQTPPRGRSRSRGRYAGNDGARDA